MRNKSFFIALSVFFKMASLCGQTYFGDLNLYSQAKIDSFPILTDSARFVDGRVLIGTFDTTFTTDVHDLTPLSTLERTHAFGIVGTSLLENLHGLEKLDSCSGAFYIWRNKRLKNLQGLNGLRYIDYPGLEIYKNDSLETLSGLNKLKKFRGSSYLYVKENPLLKNLDGIESLEEVNSILITGNKSLENVKSLKNVKDNFPYEDIYGSFFDNPNLKSLDGFTHVRNFGSLTIVNNDGLQFLGKFGSPDSIHIRGEFHIRDNDNLIDLAGLERVTEIYELAIENNTRLASLKGLDNLRSATHELLIKNNDRLKELALPSLVQIDTFSGIWATYGAKVEDNDGLAFWSGMQNLRKINSNIYISQNDSLRIIDIPNLETVGSVLGIYDNQNLLYVGPFSNLKSVGYSLGISTTAKGAEVIGFNELLRVGHDVSVGHLYQYVNGFNKLDSSTVFIGWSNAVHGFEKFLQGIDVSISAPRDSLRAFKNIRKSEGLSYTAWNPTDIGSSLDKLDSLNAFGLWTITDTFPNFSGIKCISDFMNLGQNSSVNFPTFSIIGSKFLPNVNYIGNIHAVNTGIDSLTGFTNLKTLKKGITLTENAKLVDCSALCYIFKNAAVSGPIKIDQNSWPCNSKPMILAWCDTAFVSSAAPEKPFPDFLVYPNPSAEPSFTLEVPSDFTLPAKLEIFDAMGRKMEVFAVEQNKTVFSCSKISDGLFWLLLSNGKKNASARWSIFR